MLGMSTDAIGLRELAVLQYQHEAKTFRTRRFDHKLSLRQVQEGSGVDRSIVHRYEHGGLVNAINYLALKKFEEKNFSA